MSHSGGSGYNGGQHGEGGGSFHYAVGDNYNPLGSYSDIYKIEHLTAGLRINNGIRFALLFVTFFSWLYVVYWLKHHEPVTQQSIGSNSTCAPTAKEDTSIMSCIKNAFPFKTSSDFGNLSCPSPQMANNSLKNDEQCRTIETHVKVISPPAKGNPGEAISAPINYPDPNYDQRFGSPAMRQPLPNPNSVADPIISNAPPSAYYQNQNIKEANATVYTTYKVPSHNGVYPLVKTIVNR